MIASIRMSKNLEQKIEQASRATGKSKSNLVREAVETYCDQLLAKETKFATLYDWWLSQNLEPAATGIADLSTNKDRLRRTMSERASRRRT